MNKTLPQLSFVLGGAASGKSAFAETLVNSAGKARIYIATAQVFDAEMRAKIDRHIEIRGDGWTTVEEPLDLGPVLEQCNGSEVVLLDCATLWLSNVILAERDVAVEQSALLSAVSTCPAQVIVVSNEVGMGLVPDTKLGRTFREAQGRLNIALAAQAGVVVQVVAGLPNVLKGELP